MSDEIIMAKVESFCEELKELGVEDFLFAAGSNNGLLAIKYDGEPKGVCFLAMTTLINAMFEATEGHMEMGEDGRRENNSR